MRYDQKQFTQQGLNLFTNALSQKQSITIDKVIMDNLPTSNLSNLALLTLDDFANAQSFPANYTKVDNNMLTVDSVISNQGFTNSYSANEIGLVGHVENDSDETLIAILVASDPFVLPAQQQGETPLHLIPNVTIQLSNDNMQQIPVDTAQDTYVPQNRLDELVSQHNYVKLTDADSRYVKQSDFQSEVNNSVNEKADKSYVDQNINQTNDEVSNKVDKSDLSNLQSNINSNIQPKLDSKANQSDLDSTNSNVQQNAKSIQSLQNDSAHASDLNKANQNISDNTQSIQNNENAISSIQKDKADSGDVNGKINQTLNQATTHADQNLQNANQHSDSNYSDLSNKNNILSNNLSNLKDNSLSFVRILNPSDDLNNVTQTGIYKMNWTNSAPANTMVGSNWLNAHLEVIHNDNATTQKLYIYSADSTHGRKTFIRYHGDNGDWTDWQQFATADELQNKTNDLSNTMNQQFNQANAHTDEVANQLNNLDITNQDGKLMHAGKPLLTANAPNAPSLSLSIDSNNGNIQYTITPPSIDGGASITGYTLYYVIEGNSNWQSIPLGTDNLSGEFPATQSQTYQAYAITHNYAGDSPESTTESILTAGVPTINNLTVTNAYPNGLQYNVDANGNGATITEYTIYYKKTTDVDWQSLSSSNNNGNISNLSTGKDSKYQVKSQAQNVCGSSNDSNTTTLLYINTSNLDDALTLSANYVPSRTYIPTLNVNGINDLQSVFPNIKQICVYTAQYTTSNPQSNNEAMNHATANSMPQNFVISAESVSGQTQNININGPDANGDGGLWVDAIAQGMQSDGTPTGICTSVYVF